MTTDRLLASLELENLRPFHALPDVLALRDLQDLMAYPFFSLSKRRMEPIDYTSGKVSIHVESLSERGIATIWDADILIWAASQIVEARDKKLNSSRLITATPYEILSFLGRGTSGTDYLNLKNALDRLRNTSVTTSLRSPASTEFTWINEWKPCQRGLNKPSGIALLFPEWFYDSAQKKSRILTVDRAYLGLTSTLERWLYRLVRKHGGKQQDGWYFDFEHLYQKSGSLSPFSRFAFEMRAIIGRQPLPGYTLFMEASGGRVFLAFEPLPSERNGPVDKVWKSCGLYRDVRKKTDGAAGIDTRCAGNGLTYPQGSKEGLVN